MICKNCEEEFEKGKFCPECGFPVNKKDRNSEALSMLKNIDTRTEKLEKRFAELDKKKKERKEKDEKEGNAGNPESKGILDFF